MAGVSFASLTNDGTFTGFLSRPVAYLPNYNRVLIAETDENRIGIYNAKTLEFNCWLEHPNPMKGTEFKFPTCFLQHKNGHFFILEETQINILNCNFAPYQQPILGKFSGISKGPNEDILIIQLHQGP